MGGQTEKLVSFLSQALGGPAEYKGRSMISAHVGARKKGMTEHHFELVATHLQGSLEEAGVPEGLRTEVLEVIGSLKQTILNGK